MQRIMQTSHAHSYLVPGAIWTVYLIHLKTKLHHAQHYCGITNGDYHQRLLEHRAGKWTPGEDVDVVRGGVFGEYHGEGSTFLGACNYNGIEYDIVRVWIDVDPRLERDLKNTHHLSRYCPVCMNGNPRDI